MSKSGMFLSSSLVPKALSRKKGAHTYRGALFPFAGDSSKPEFQACHLFPLPLFLPIFGALDFLPHTWTWRNERLVWHSSNSCPQKQLPPQPQNLAGKWPTLSRESFGGKRLQANIQCLGKIRGTAGHGRNASTLQCRRGTAAWGPPQG